MFVVRSQTELEAVPIDAEQLIFLNADGTFFGAPEQPVQQAPVQAQQPAFNFGGGNGGFAFGGGGGFGAAPPAPGGFNFGGPGAGFGQPAQPKPQEMLYAQMLTKYTELKVLITCGVYIRDQIKNDKLEILVSVQPTEAPLYSLLSETIKQVITFNVDLRIPQDIAVKTEVLSNLDGRANIIAFKAKYLTHDIMETLSQHLPVPDDLKTEIWSQYCKIANLVIIAPEKLICEIDAKTAIQKLVSMGGYKFMNGFDAIQQKFTMEKVQLLSIVFEIIKTDQKKQQLFKQISAFFNQNERFQAAEKLDREGFMVFVGIEKKVADLSDAEFDKVIINSKALTLESKVHYLKNQFQTPQEFRGGFGQQVQQEENAKQDPSTAFVAAVLESSVTVAEKKELMQAVLYGLVQKPERGGYGPQKRPRGMEPPQPEEQDVGKKIAELSITILKEWLLEKKEIEERKELLRKYIYLENFFGMTGETTITLIIGCKLQQEDAMALFIDCHHYLNLEKTAASILFRIKNSSTKTKVFIAKNFLKLNTNEQVKVVLDDENIDQETKDIVLNHLQILQSYELYQQLQVIEKNLDDENSKLKMMISTYVEQMNSSCQSGQ